MEISVDVERKCAMVGLNNIEKDDPNVWKNLQPMMDEYKEKNYLFVIFESDKRKVYFDKGILRSTN